MVKEIKEDDGVKLSNGKSYVVIKKMTIDEKTYVFLVNTEFMLDMMFCEEKHQKNKELELIPIQDIQLLEKLFKEFGQAVNDDPDYFKKLLN